MAGAMALGPVFVISKVWPSGLDRLTKLAAIVPAAPGWLSTTIGWPRAAASGVATMRASTSAVPPAVYGTTRWTGVWANAGGPANADASSASTARTARMKCLLGLFSASVDRIEDLQLDGRQTGFANLVVRHLPEQRLGHQAVLARRFARDDGEVQASRLVGKRKTEPGRVESLACRLERGTDGVEVDHCGRASEAVLRGSPSSISTTCGAMSSARCCKRSSGRLAIGCSMT